MGRSHRSLVVRLQLKQFLRLRTQYKKAELPSSQQVSVVLTPGSGYAKVIRWWHNAYCRTAQNTNSPTGKTSDSGLRKTQTSLERKPEGRVLATWVKDSGPNILSMKESD